MWAYCYSIKAIKLSDLSLSFLPQISLSLSSSFVKRTCNVPFLWNCIHNTRKKNIYYHIKIMTIIYSSLFSPNFTAFSSTKPFTKVISSHPYLPSSPIQWKNPKRDFQLPSVASIPYPPINVDYLETEFDGHGVSFASISDSCVVKMKLDNGSVVSLMLPSGLITSYKAPMWHGGKLELLHTLVSEAEGGGAVIQGGVSLAFKCESDEGVSWSPSTWALHDVRGSSEDFIQVC